MECPKCKVIPFKNTVLGKDFWVCRTCKEEVYDTDKTIPLDLKAKAIGKIWTYSTGDEVELVRRINIHPPGTIGTVYVGGHFKSSDIVSVYILMGGGTHYVYAYPDELKVINKAA